MNRKRILLLLFISIITAGYINHGSTSCIANTSSMQSFNTQESNQLLRISLEPGGEANEVNVYLYTSTPDPIIQEKRYSDKSFVIDLQNTVIATTNNINLEKVSSNVSKIKIVPFLNTTNPLLPGMTRVVIDSKVADVTYKIVLKSFEIKNTPNNELITKVYYPTDDDQPQSMAFFTPIDDSIISQIPKETLNTSLPDENLIAQSLPDDNSKLTVSPSANSELPSINNNIVQDLPELDNVVPPVVAENNEPAQEGQSPQPEPQAQPAGLKAFISKEIIGLLWPICGGVLLVMVILIVLIFLKLKNKKPLKTNNNSNGIPTSPMIQPEIEAAIKGSSFTPVEDNDFDQEIFEETTTAQTPSVQSEPYAEEVEQVEVVTSVEIDEKKSLYLVEFSNAISLIGSINNDVFVLYNFKPKDLSSVTRDKLFIDVTKEGNVIGKEIYLVKVAHWQGVILCENNKLSFHSNLSAP